VDGSGKARQFFQITLPMLTPVIFFNLIQQIIQGFMAFTQSYIVTQGGPMNSTLFYAVYMYQRSFKFYEMGYGSALAWLMLIIVGIDNADTFQDIRQMGLQNIGGGLKRWV
jgi:multiple sugar transport system permease protein